MTLRCPFLIDTDPWCDDALAIMFAINSGLDVTTITTVSGNVDEGLVYDNARWILDFMNPAPAIRLCRWADRPLVREPFFAKSHGKGGLWGVEVLRSPNDSDGNAIDAIIAFANANEEWKIIALWPLTNIALAIRKDPASMSRIGELVIMGGTIDVPGNVWPVSEFNFYVDPEAAKEVFDFPIPKTLIPIDVCNQAVVPLADLRNLRWPNADSIQKIAIPYGDNVDGEERLGWAVMYDPVAVYYAFVPSKFELRKMDISIETEGSLTRGMCVVERRKSANRPPNVSVAVRVDSDAFKRDFLRALEF